MGWMVGQWAYGYNGLSVLDYGLETMSRAVWNGDARRPSCEDVGFYCQALHSKREDSINLEHSMKNGLDIVYLFFPTQS